MGCGPRATCRAACLCFDANACSVGGGPNSGRIVFALWVKACGDDRAEEVGRRGEPRSQPLVVLVVAFGDGGLGRSERALRGATTLDHLDGSRDARRSVFAVETRFLVAFVLRVLGVREARRHKGVDGVELVARGFGVLADAVFIGGSRARPRTGRSFPRAVASSLDERAQDVGGVPRSSWRCSDVNVVAQLRGRHAAMALGHALQLHQDPQRDRDDAGDGRWPQRSPVHDRRAAHRRTGRRARRRYRACEARLPPRATSAPCESFRTAGHPCASWRERRRNGAAEPFGTFPGRAVNGCARRGVERDERGCRCPRPARSLHVVSEGQAEGPAQPLR